MTPTHHRRQTSPTPYLAIFTFLAMVFLATAMITYSSTDWPNPHVYPHAEAVHNACGKVGAWISYQIIRLIGLGIYPLIFLVAAGSLLWLRKGPLDQLIQRAIGIAVLVTVTSSATYAIWTDEVTYLPAGYAGALGQSFGSLLQDNFSDFGTFLILAYCVLAALLFTIDGFWSRMVQVAGGTHRAVGISLAKTRAATIAVASASSNLIKPSSLFRRSRNDSSMASSTPPSFADRTAKRSPRAAILDGEALHEPDERSASSEADTCDRESRKSRSTAGTRIIFRSNKPEPQEAAGCYPPALDDWVLPPISLLEVVEYTAAAEQESYAREKAKVLEKTLNDFRIEAPVVEIDTGPVITMYELQLAPGVKVSQIAALANDIARALRAPAVRVVAPIPGKNTVGIEVPRMDREKVRLKELMTMAGGKAQEMILPLFVGKDASGKPIIQDLTRMPHLLIAGTTGSGKSVCINSIIMSLLMTQRPDRVKMILIDPKMVELSAFKEIPHLMSPVVTDMHKAEQILEWACTKMEERYALFAEAGVRNIQRYNQLDQDEILERFQPSTEEEANLIPPYVPYIVIVIDELADLMMNSKEVEYHLARLTQKSRAVGVHIVVATQRPEAKVVTGLIKSNLPCRCAFRVAARLDSRIVLDQNGAEVLLGQGDMLFLPPGSAHLIRAQGTFISDPEIRRVNEDIKSKGKCEFHPELMNIQSSSKTGSGERDEQFDEAVRIVLETQRGSVSLLQRRLTIGYSRASRLIDQMADAGIVGAYKGSQAREVLMTLKEWEVLKEQIASELEEGYEADQDDYEEAEEVDDDVFAEHASLDPND